MLTDNSFRESASQANHLKGQGSPYLLQHLYNPVDWYPWGEEALEKAVRENKPILVSIGYSSCHWCHVMEKESFEDPEVAEIMNRDFVCIKVDREERPDIDHLYMTAVQLLSRQGGWPLNCFALPDTRPFWGGTYFPKESWKSILNQVAVLFKTRYIGLAEQAEQLREGIAASSLVETTSGAIKYDKQDAENVCRNILKYMDVVEGGTLHAPKFPLPVNLEFLLHYFYFTKDTASLMQVNLRLEKMAMGGIYDQIGGGFARYSTDEYWKVPHFEKMLYDNAQLLSLYSNAWKVTQNPLYREVVYQTIEFISRELSSPEGYFYCALDADSEGEEGKFYVWNEAEMDRLLGSDAPLIKEYYQAGKKGLWENGANILLRTLNESEFATRMRISEEKFREVLQNSRDKLFSARSLRIRPSLDNKILVSWNALMIKALADAYAAFNDRGFLDKARKAADLILRNYISDKNSLFRTKKGLNEPVDGFLEDYALFIRSLIRLFEVTMEAEYLLKAESLTLFVMEHFTTKNSSLFTFSVGKKDKLAAAHFESSDGVIPSSNSIMAWNLLLLGELFGRHEWIKRSTQMLTDMHMRLNDHSISYASWGQLMLCHAFSIHTMVITGPEAERNVREMVSMYLPGVIIAGTNAENNDIPIFANRNQRGKNLFFVCSGGECQLPVEGIEEALKLLK